MATKNKRSVIALGIAMAMAFAPSAAFASTGSLQPTELGEGAFGSSQVYGKRLASLAGEGSPEGEAAGESASAATGWLYDELHQAISNRIDQIEAEKVNKVLPYDRTLIEQIGTQEKTGHTICCPSFSCAYADAVMDGTVHDHSYYTCSCCSWTDWGGGDSSFRSVGTDEQLLREAYDQISSGKPTVIHVRASYGEHWIALIGYENAADPDHLSLSNFVALDPWDGAQVNAGASFALYGDGCEHVSERTA